MNHYDQSWVIKCPHFSHHPTIRYMVYNGYFFRWCPIFPKWGIYQPLINHVRSGTLKTSLRLRGLIVAQFFKLHGKRLTERRLFFQPWRVHFACVFSRICVWVLFFSLLSPKTNCFFLNFSCVRLPSLCFTCVSRLESNFYRHHLDLRKVSTSCTTSVWPVYRSRRKPDPMNSFKFCQWRSITLCSCDLGQMTGNGAQWKVR